MSRPIAILAGGLATRLGAHTKDTPKSLLEVAGQPFVLHQIQLLRRKGLTRIVLCVGHQGEKIENYLGDGAAFGVELLYSYDGPELKGTGGALKRALPLLDESFFVLYGDSYLDIDYAAVGAAFDHSDAKGLMTVYRNQNQWDRSNILFRNSKIVCYDKKHPLPEMQHIDYGLGVLRSDVLNAFPDDESFDLSDVYRSLIDQNQLAGYEVSQRFYEIGSVQGLEETDSYLTARINQPGSLN